MSTKRANPFTEDFIPQSKIHVGLKQLNNNNERLKNVYEKTLELLFKGAKKVPESDICNNNNDPQFNKKDKMKQLFIGKDGSLLHTGNVISKSMEVKKCGCGNILEIECSYCESSLCAQCVHGCAACQQNYCAQCTLADMEGTEVCVSCYQ